MVVVRKVRVERRTVLNLRDMPTVMCWGGTVAQSAEYRLIRGSACPSRTELDTK